LKKTKRAGFKPAPTSPDIFALFAFFAANLLFGCGSAALGSLRQNFRAGPVGTGPYKD
jgi:hypothetical protein